jgi:hypothetical protein
MLAENFCCFRLPIALPRMLQRNHAAAQAKIHMSFRNSRVTAAQLAKAGNSRYDGLEVLQTVSSMT